MADREGRFEQTAKIAQYLNCSQLLIFLKDKEVDLLLPAPGFPQTLYIDQQWDDFFKQTTKYGIYRGTLPYPDKHTSKKATGLASFGESVAILLDCDPENEKLKELTDLLPLLCGLLIQEQIAIHAQTKASFAENMAIRAEKLTKTMDNMRQVLKEGLLKQEKDKTRIGELLKKKDEFMNIASHELKTPITSLKAYMQLLHGGKATSMPKVLADKSLKQLRRLENLINDLLQVSKIANGRLDYNMGTVDFSLLIKDTVESIQIISPNHKLIIKNNPSVLVEGDKERLEQVLVNYLNNAVKYSPKSDTVIIDSKVVDDNMIVSVQDFGEGIEAEHFEKLFDRFYRVDNTAMKYEGLGLGLYISAEIIKRHDGSLWIESVKGQGSTFFFRLQIKHKPANMFLTDHKTFYKNKNFEIQYEEAQNWMYINWLGYQSFDTVKEGSMLLMDLFKKNNCTKILDDNSLLLGSWSEAADWGAEYWFPTMSKLGLKKMAWITSPTAFSQFAAKKASHTVIGAVTIEFFNNLAEAAEWLENDSI
ncbi:MAG: hypothetical protein NVSMB24_39910 [Mucilaginibacter sp.]